MVQELAFEAFASGVELAVGVLEPGLGCLRAR